MTETTAKSVFELEGPSGNSIVGSLAELGEDPLGFLMRCDRDYKDIIPLRLGLTPACFVTNPELIEQVLKSRESFVKSRGFRALNTLLGSGLLTNEGESWFRQRRLAQPVFHRSRIQGYGKIMVDYTEQMLAGWQPNETRDIHADMMRLTLGIVMKAIFSKDVSTQEAESVAQALDVAMNWFDSKRRQNFLIWEWFPRPENIRYRNAIASMDKTIYGIIRDRRNAQENPQAEDPQAENPQAEDPQSEDPQSGTQADPGDLLSMLMAARDEDDGTGMSDQQLRDEIATLMLAGHETTANALSWTWMLLSQNPEAGDKLKTEIEDVLGGRLPTVEDLSHLPYANAVIKESMRLYPPVPLLGREAAEDVEVGTYLVPKGCVVIISQWVMHHKEDYFEAAEAFRPERWLADLEKQLPRGVYFPFGDGPRICIGKSFALMEAVLILTTVFQRYQPSLVLDHEIVPQPSITLRPETGIQITLKERS